MLLDQLLQNYFIILKWQEFQRGMDNMIYFRNGSVAFDHRTQTGGNHHKVLRYLNAVGFDWQLFAFPGLVGGSAKGFFKS